MKGHEKDLVFFLKLLLNPEILGPIQGTFVSVDDGHAANLIQSEAD
jgi:hypothetical protein